MAVPSLGKRPISNIKIVNGSWPELVNVKALDINHDMTLAPPVPKGQTPLLFLPGNSRLRACRNSSCSQCRVGFGYAMLAEMKDRSGEDCICMPLDHAFHQMLKRANPAARYDRN